LSPGRSFLFLSKFRRFLGILTLHSTLLQFAVLVCSDNKRRKELTDNDGGGSDSGCSAAGDGAGVSVVVVVELALALLAALQLKRCKSAAGVR